MVAASAPEHVRRGFSCTVFLGFSSSIALGAVLFRWGEGIDVTPTRAWCLLASMTLAVVLVASRSQGLTEPPFVEPPPRL